MSMASAEDGEYGFASEYKELAREARRQRRRARAGLADDDSDGMGISGFSSDSGIEEHGKMEESSSFPSPPPPPRRAPAAAAAAASSSAAHPRLAPNGMLWNSPRSIERVCLYWTWGYCKYDESCRYIHPEELWNTAVRPQPPPRFAEGDGRYNPELARAQAIPIAHALQFQLQNAAARERARDDQIHRLEAQVQSLNNTLSMQSQMHSQALAHGRLAVDITPLMPAMQPMLLAVNGSRFLPAIAAVARPRKQKRTTKKKKGKQARQGVADAAAQADRDAAAEAAKIEDGDDAIHSDGDADDLPARAYIRAKRKDQPAMQKHKPPRGAAAAAAAASSSSAAAGAGVVSPVAAAAASMSSLRVRTKLGVSGQKRAHETNTDNEVATNVEIFTGTPAHLAGVNSASGARRLPPIPTHNAQAARRMQLEADGSDEEVDVKTEASAGEESMPDAPARSTRSTRSRTQGNR